VALYEPLAEHWAITTTTPFWVLDDITGEAAWTHKSSPLT
jgi:hypothetical protein